MLNTAILNTGGMRAPYVCVRCALVCSVRLFEIRRCVTSVRLHALAARTGEGEGGEATEASAATGVGRGG
eukprot:6125990-Pleurochrysis_carterae.AAC.3